MKQPSHQNADTPAATSQNQAPTSQPGEHMPPDADVVQQIRRAHAITPQEILHLQRTLSNRTIGKLLDNAPHPQQPPNRTGLPNDLKTRLETRTGIALDDLRVHYHSPHPASIQAQAYTHGTQIHIGPGQEKHLAHEAWHAVQQKQGRVTPDSTLHGVPLNTNTALETEAQRATTAQPHALPHPISAQRTPVLQLARPGAIQHAMSSCFAAALINIFTVTPSLKNLLIPTNNNLNGNANAVQLQNLLLRAVNTVHAQAQVPVRWVQNIMVALRNNGIIQNATETEDVNLVLGSVIRVLRNNNQNAGQPNNRPVSSGLIVWDSSTTVQIAAAMTIQQLQNTDWNDQNGVIFPNVIHINRQIGNTAAAPQTFTLYPTVGNPIVYRLRSAIYRSVGYIGGHFISYIDRGDALNAEWWESDDIGPSVQPIQNIQNVNAAPPPIDTAPKPSSSSSSSSSTNQPSTIPAKISGGTPSLLNPTTPSKPLIAPPTPSTPNSTTVSSSKPLVPAPSPSTALTGGQTTPSKPLIAPPTPSTPNSTTVSSNNKPLVPSPSSVSPTSKPTTLAAPTTTTLGGLSPLSPLNSLLVTASKPTLSQQTSSLPSTTSNLPSDTQPTSTPTTKSPTAKTKQSRVAPQGDMLRSAITYIYERSDAQEVAQLHPPQVADLDHNIQQNLSSTYTKDFAAAIKKSAPTDKEPDIGEIDEADYDQDLQQALEESTKDLTDIINLPPIKVGPEHLPEAQRQLQLQLQGMKRLTMKQWVLNTMLNRLKTTDQIMGPYSTPTGKQLKHKIDAHLTKNDQLAALLMDEIIKRMQALATGMPPSEIPQIITQIIQLAQRAKAAKKDIYRTFTSAKGLIHLSQLTQIRIKGGIGRQHGEGDENWFRKTHDLGVHLAEHGTKNTHAVLHNPDQCVGGSMDIVCDPKEAAQLQQARKHYESAIQAHKKAQEHLTQTQTSGPAPKQTLKTTGFAGYFQPSNLSAPDPEAQKKKIQTATAELENKHNLLAISERIYVELIRRHYGDFTVNSLLGDAWMRALRASNKSRVELLLDQALSRPMDTWDKTPMAVSMNVIADTGIKKKTREKSAKNVAKKDKTLKQLKGGKKRKRKSTPEPLHKKIATKLTKLKAKGPTTNQTAIEDSLFKAGQQTNKARKTEIGTLVLSTKASAIFTFRQILTERDIPINETLLTRAFALGEDTETRLLTYLDMLETYERVSKEEADSEDESFDPTTFDPEQRVLDQFRGMDEDDTDEETHDTDAEKEEEKGGEY